MENIDEMNAIKEFESDIECLKELETYSKKSNLFEILGISTMEIKHSNMLAWLLDPNENHGLQDSFLNEFFKSAGIKIPSSVLKSFGVQREYNYMDIVMSSVDTKTVVVIENKVFAKEGKGQLTDYIEKTEELFPGYKPHFVFLTPNGTEPSNRNWRSLSYKEIVKKLKKCINKIELELNSKLLIDNYIENVRKNVLKEQNEELVKKCDEIYKKHKVAIDLIFENSAFKKQSVNDEIADALSKMPRDNNGFEYRGDIHRLGFFNKDLDEFIPPEENLKNYWKKLGNYIHEFWFKDDTLGLKLIIDIGKNVVNPNLRKNLEEIYKYAEKPQEKDSKTKTIFNFKEKINKDSVDGIKSAVERLVNTAIDKEREIIANAENYLEKQNY